MIMKKHTAMTLFRFPWRKLSALLLPAVLVACAQASVPPKSAMAAPSFIPVPASIQLQDGGFALSAASVIVADGVEDGSIDSSAGLLDMRKREHAAGTHCDHTERQANSS